MLQSMQMNHNIVIQAYAFLHWDPMHMRRLGQEVTSLYLQRCASNSLKFNVCSMFNQSFLQPVSRSASQQLATNSHLQSQTGR